MALSSVLAFRLSSSVEFDHSLETHEEMREDVWPVKLLIGCSFLPVILGGGLADVLGVGQSLWESDYYGSA